MRLSVGSKIKHLSAAVEIFDQEIGGAIRKIPLHNIQPSEEQPRQNKNVNIDTLANSLSQDGLLQPILVTGRKGNYTIIAGERRYHAAVSLNWIDIECRILDKNKQETYKLAVIENLQRENLSPLEESLAYQKLKQKFNYSDSELSKIVGKSRNYITEILSIAEISYSTLLEAKKADITSKNMLIQLAQAVKKKVANEFIDQFQSDQISTVREAKIYLKNTSNIKKNKKTFEVKKVLPSHEAILQKNEPIEDTFPSIQIKKNQKNSTLEIKIITPALRLDDILINSVENILKEALDKTIKAYAQPIA